MKRYNQLTAMLAGFALLSSCWSPSDSGTSITFIAQINNYSNVTRTVNDGSVWEKGDDVGIFMCSSATGTIAVNGVNAKFSISNSTTGLLGPAGSGNHLNYPVAELVDFKAYYPYTSSSSTSGADPEDVAIDLSKQTSVAKQNDCDFLYSNNATNCAKADTSVVLKFNHALAKIKLNINVSDEVAASLGVDVNTLIPYSSIALHNMPTSATFDLLTGVLTPGTVAPGTTTLTMLRSATAETGYVATYTAVIVPQTQPVLIQRAAVLTLDTYIYPWSIDNADLFLPGKLYTYNLTVGGSGTMTIETSDITDWTEHDNGTTTANPI